MRAAIDDDVVAPELAGLDAVGVERDDAQRADPGIGGEVAVHVQRDVAAADIAQNRQVAGIGEAERGAGIGIPLQPDDVILPVGPDAAAAVERQRTDRGLPSDWVMAPVASRTIPLVTTILPARSIAPLL